MDVGASSFSIRLRINNILILRARPDFLIRLMSWYWLWRHYLPSMLLLLRILCNSNLGILILVMSRSTLYSIDILLVDSHSLQLIDPLDVHICICILDVYIWSFLYLVILPRIGPLHVLKLMHSRVTTTIISLYKLSGVIDVHLYYLTSWVTYSLIWTTRHSNLPVVLRVSIISPALAIHYI